MIGIGKLRALINGQICQFDIAFEKRANLTLLFFALMFVLNIAVSSSANAQAVSWTQADIGSTGAAGTYSYSAGTYTISGAGTGIGSSADSFSYVSTPTTGNIEMIAKVTSQTNTSNYAVSGLMMRDSLNANGVEAVIGVSPTNGVNFTYRSTAGGASNTMLGPSIAAPVWLRLVHSGTSFAGYQSSDGISWTLVGSISMAMPSSYNVGFAVCSNSYGNLSTAVFNSVAYMANVPQRSANLITWLRADSGVKYSSGQVSQWIDQSGNGNNANQTVLADQPTLSTGAINGLPAVGFNGSSQCLQFGSGFANFTTGASIFVVTNPASVGSFQHWVSFGNATTNSLGLQQTSTAGSVSFYTYNGTSGSTATVPSALSAGSYQLVESVYNGTNTATIYNNGVLKGSGSSLLTAPNSTRTSNYLGEFAGGGAYYFNGTIAEILVYNTALTASQRAAVESYIYSKYAIGNQPTSSTPTISPGYGVFSTSPQAVTITADPGAQIFYTTDGSTPTLSSTLYSRPFNITNSTTVKAIAIAPFFTSSAVASAYLQLDPATANLPQTNLITWLKADNGVLTSGSNVTQWTDMSSLANNATQSVSGDQPTLVTNAVNGLPALSFNGTSDFLQFGSGFANFTAGMSIFVVVNPASLGTYQEWVEFGNPSSNYIGLEALNTSGSFAFYAYSGSSGASVNAASAVSAGQYQLLESVYNGTNTATLYTNGVQKATGSSLVTAPNATRTNNYVGQSGSSGSYATGQIAEILVYNSALSTAQRAAVESYLFSRYGLAVNPPVITPTSPAVYTSPQTITITADPGAQIYYTTNGSTPTTSSTLYTGPFSLSTNGATTIKAIAVQSFGTSTVSSVTLAIDLGSVAIPRTNLSMWLRSDLGVVSSGGAVSQWTDMSGTGNTATQSVSAHQPTLISNAINGLPSLSFNGSSQYMQLPGGFANFTSGLTLFVVGNPNVVTTGGGRFLDLGTNNVTNSLGLAVGTSTQGEYFQFNSSTLYDILGSSPLNQYHLMDVLQNGAGTATFNTDGILTASGSIPAIPNVTRSYAFIGQFNAGGTAFLQGQIAEMLLYNTALTAMQRTAVESYLIQKYQFGLQTSMAPTISVAAGTLNGPTQVAIAAQSGASVYYTTDGTTPTTSSNLYAGPINVYFSETLKAIAVTNGVSSSVSSAAYTLNSTQWPAPASGGPALQINVQLPTTAVPQ